MGNLLNLVRWELLPRLVDGLLTLAMCRVVYLTWQLSARWEACGREESWCAYPASKVHGTESSVQATPAPQPIEMNRFVIHSLFLLRSFRFVCAGPNEVFHVATGAELDGRFVITDIVPVSFAQQSRGHVRVADASASQALEELDRLGLQMLAHVHSHPGSGKNATQPSLTDERFVDRLARGGYVAIGIIFSRDGHFRFFGTVPFEIEIVGNYVEQIDEDESVFRLSPLASAELSLVSTGVSVAKRGAGW